MIHGIRARWVLAACFFLQSIRFCEAQYSYTREFTSNDVLGVAGDGRAVAMVTSRGFNYTADITRTPIDWHGVLGPVYIGQGSHIGVSSGHALVCLYPAGSDQVNELFLYTFPDTYTTIDLAYKSNVFLDSVGSDVWFAFWGVHATWFQGSFWVACLDGGLARVTPPLNTVAIFYPGRDSVAYTFDSFLPDRFPIFPDSTARAIAVAPDSQMIWCACEKALWAFDPVDTLWTRIDDSLLNVFEYYDIQVRPRNDTTVVYTVFSQKNGEQIDTCFYTYNNKTDQWHRFITTGDIIVQSVTPGAHGYVYVLDKRENALLMFQDTVPDTALAPHIPYAKRVLQNGNNIDFQSRIVAIQNALGINTILLSDMSYAVAGTDTLFQVATDGGLLYSNNEHYDEINTIPFAFEYRKVTLKDDCEKTYAVPGILNNNHPRTVFAYNLARDDYVTIDIFDYNMDHVVRIIDKAWRQAGRNRTGGRSTIPMYDCWDGTVSNSNGRPVPPGVYFYRIKTKKGTRDFGRIIVAKN